LLRGCALAAGGYNCCRVLQDRVAGLVRTEFKAIQPRCKNMIKIKNITKLAFISWALAIPLVCNAQSFLDPRIKPCISIDENTLRMVALKNGGTLDTRDVRSTNDYRIKSYSFDNDSFDIVVRVNSNRVQSVLISDSENSPFSELFENKIFKLIETEFGVEASEKNIDDTDTAFRTVIRGRVWPTKNMVKADSGHLTMWYIGDPRVRPRMVFPIKSKNFTFQCTSQK
jgi:hypothetical protein